MVVNQGQHPAMRSLHRCLQFNKSTIAVDISIQAKTFVQYDSHFLKSEPYFNTCVQRTQNTALTAVPPGRKKSLLMSRTSVPTMIENGICFRYITKEKAASRTRTDENLLITNQLRYQLRHCGIRHCYDIFKPSISPYLKEFMITSLSSTITIVEN